MTQRVRITILQGDVVETIWAEILAEANFCVDSIPFFVYNVSLSDTIIAADKDGVLTFQGVYQKSGNRTLRILIGDSASDIAFARQRVTELLTNGQLKHEWFSEMLVAVNVPPDADIEELLVQITTLRDLSVNWEYGDPQPDRCTYAVPGSPAEQTWQQLLRKREQDLNDWMAELMRPSKP